jgi:GAF domain-containing protein
MMAAIAATLPAMPEPFVDLTALERSLATLRAAPTGGRLGDDLRRVMVASLELFGATGAGIMMVDEDSALSAVAATDEPARLLEVRQQDLSIGPCIDALILNRVVSTDDLAADPRWPALVPEVSDAGVRAILGVPIGVGGLPVGSLNVYRDQPDSWDQSSNAALMAYASVIEGVLESALAMREREQLTDQLQRALDNRVLIERAVGVMMAQRRVDAVAAFGELRSVARGSGRRVAEVAAEVLAAVTGA